MLGVDTLYHPTMEFQNSDLLTQRILEMTRRHNNQPNNTCETLSTVGIAHLSLLLHLCVLFIFTIFTFDIRDNQISTATYLTFDFRHKD